MRRNSANLLTRSATFQAVRSRLWQRVADRIDLCESARSRLDSGSALQTSPADQKNNITFFFIIIVG